MLAIYNSLAAIQTMTYYERRFEKYDLVIADELGYISFDKEGAEFLFTNLSLRASRKSIIITTNLSFDRWEELFGDPEITSAMVDRLTHKAYLVDMQGNSYRLREKMRQSAGISGKPINKRSTYKSS